MSRFAASPRRFLGLRGDTGLEVEVLIVAALRQSPQVTRRTPGEPQELVVRVPPANTSRHGVEAGKHVRVRLRGRCIVVMHNDEG